MAASGQKIQHARHLVHLDWSILGVKVLQKPVFPKAPSPGLERHVKGKPDTDLDLTLIKVKRKPRNIALFLSG